MTSQLLFEHLTPAQAGLREQLTGGQLYLSGVLAQSECVNGNFRKYPLAELSKAFRLMAERITEGHLCAGELGHPDVLTINLANVSHAITEVHMDGNNAVGKMRILNTPSGNIARGLIEGGIRLGVSTRGTGNVSESGDVSDFTCVTVDVVHQPSAPDAYPDVVQEAMGNQRVQTLAEAMVHDKKAQAYFKREMVKFLSSITKRK